MNFNYLEIFKNLYKGKAVIKAADEGANIVKTTTKATSKLLPSDVKLAEQPEKDLFCHQYWKNKQENNEIRNNILSSVKNHCDFNAFNYIFNPHSVTPDLKNPNNLLKGKSISQTIRNADIDFKTLPPTKEPIIAYRTVGEKPDFFAESKLYEKSAAIKEGDTMVMRGYAYATPEKDYADVYLSDGKGIRYKFLIDKGARVSISGDEVVFPRYSKFKCMSATQNGDVKDVVLKFIPPQEPWRK